MSDMLVVLTPLLVLLLLAVFRFVGCTPFTAAEPKPGTVAGPGLGVADPDAPPVVEPPGAGPTYQEMIEGTLGFLALWRLNETGGNVAQVLGPLGTAANGVYTAPAGLRLGEPGVLNHRDPGDFAPEFLGTAAYVEVQYVAQLNPGAQVPFSIELWVRPDTGSGPDTQTVISSHRVEAANSQQGYEIQLIRTAGQPHQQIRARVFSGAAVTDVTVQPVQGDPQEWRYVLMTYRGAAGADTLELYVKVAQTTSPFVSSPVSASYDRVRASSAATLRFGANHGTGQSAGSFFAGRIDEVAFYSAALEPTVIEARFNRF